MLSVASLACLAMLVVVSSCGLGFHGIAVVIVRDGPCLGFLFVVAGWVALCFFVRFLCLEWLARPVLLFGALARWALLGLFLPGVLLCVGVAVFLLGCA